MTPHEANNAIFRAWMIKWPIAVGVDGGSNPLVPYSLDNNVRVDATIAARVQITELGTDQLTLGPPGKRKFETHGIIQVRLNGLLKVGSGPLLDLGQKVRDIFQATRFGPRARDGGVWTYATSIGNARIDPEARTTRLVLCTTPFKYTSVS